MDNFNVELKYLEMTDTQFYELCVNNRDFRFERNSKGDLIIMSPTGGETGNRNGRLIQQLFNWNDIYHLGIAFDSSTGFTLPNGNDRSPDVGWIPINKWENLTLEQRQKFLPLCPDFVIELRSYSDNLIILQEKMQEYQENGTLLGWLINPQNKQVEIYRPNQQVEILNNPSSLSGENILPNFRLNLGGIW